MNNQLFKICTLIFKINSSNKIFILKLFKQKMPIVYFVIIWIMINANAS